MFCIDTIRTTWLSRRGNVRPAAGETVRIDTPAQSAAPATLMASRDVRPLLTGVADRLAEWQNRQAGRRLLMTLDDRALRDIGLDRAAADEEYRKPFWR